jgi:hypothetical protein
MLSYLLAEERPKVILLRNVEFALPQGKLINHRDY